ncbi:MAG: flagellar hook-length control protein FliK, partial [Hyphomicrobiales bacterium]
AAQSRGGALPDAVMSAMTQLLGLRLNANGKPVTAGALQRAVMDSGLFMEARQASGQPQPAGDMKAALLALRGALAGWLGGGMPAPARMGERPMPPLRGIAPRGQPAGSPPPAGIDGKGLGRLLLDQADAALSRVRLSQMASLPEAHATREGQGRAAAAEWHFELPLAASGATGMAQFRVSRDGGGNGEAEREGRGWRMEVAVDFEATGGIHADVSLRGGVLGVSLLAERGETADELRAALPELGEALAAQGLTVGRLACRQGVPERPAPAAGHFMDEAS